MEIARSPNVLWSGAVGLAGSALALGLALAFSGQGSSGAGATASQACYMLLLGLAGFGCLARAAAERGERAAWLAIGLGLASWWMADLGYWLSPSLPTLVENMGYVGLYAGAALGVALLTRRSHHGSGELVDGVIALLGAAAVWAWLVLDHVSTDQLDSLGAHPAAGLTLAVAALALIGTGWQLSARWALLSGGLLSIAIADSIYLVLIDHGAYVSGTALDFLWPAGAIAVAGAAWTPLPARPSGESQRLSMWVASGAMFAALVVLVADHFAPVGTAALALSATTVALGVIQAMVNHARRLTAERSLRLEARNTVLALAAAVDAKDRYTRSHSENVSHYARTIAERLGLPAATVERITVAGHLHDVGKIAVPDAILLKRGRLTDGEFDVMKAHAAEGERIVRSVGLDDLAPWIRHHHERWDGRGYPDRRIGEESPIEARILAGADSLDAMTSSRAYSSAMSADEARREIAANSGGQFDPDVAQTILDLIREGAFPRPHTAEQHEPRQLLSVIRPTNGRLPREAKSPR
jgi:hypothetical protein